MFKKFLIAATLILTAGSLSAADLKIGVVDIQAVLQQAPQLKTVGESIQKKFKEQQDELAALRKKGTDLQEKAKRDAMTMTNPEKLKIQRELQSLDAEFELKQKFLEEDVSFTSKQERAKIMQRIMQAVKKVSEEEKFDLVVRSDVALHASSAINITNKVIALVSNPAG
ncbi:OmpH family outer membrane protein [Aliikangiella coralliicola]|uniref:OmpH family outer membrane protein n=1 Tax=Aliikangiella coralliicola TaxID=2592383 RepID=A0A545UAZ3_9GAMM|nr:OmpH family outer membrane protein [Aliikangiella coralliicola]TQV86636.1 OmpH family outer membrane protein [Aliikangiella coralliicola]